jgi:hypothetical protein
MRTLDETYGRVHWDRIERHPQRANAAVNRVIALQPGANPKITSYNASVVNFYNATGSLARFENINILFCFEKRSSLLQRWRCGCKFKSRKIGTATDVFFGSATPCAFPPPQSSVYFLSFFSCPPPCKPGWPASPCTCNGLWLHSHMAVFSKRTIFLLRIKLHPLSS